MRYTQEVWKNRASRAALIGTLLECYDNALYGFMAPILVGVFLPEVDPLNALILAYAIYPLKILFKPLGALTLGFIGDCYGRKQALSISIIGMAVVVGGISLLPTYASIGIWAPIAMLASRMLQAFFAAGEYNGAAIFLLEHMKGRSPGRTSGLYCAICVVGILIASFMASLVASWDWMSWRVPYVLACLTGLYGLYLRRGIEESPAFEKAKAAERVRAPLRASIRHSWRMIVAAMSTAACFAAMCYLSSSFLVAYLPLVTPFSKASILQLNTLGLCIYMLSLYVSGSLSDRVGIARMMQWAAWTTAVLAVPLWLLLHTENFFAIVLFKLTASACAGWFIGPFHAWIQSIFSVQNRYTFVSLAYTLGAQLGAVTPLLGFTLWKSTGWIAAPSLLLIGFTVLAGLGLAWTQGSSAKRIMSALRANL